MAPMSAAKPPAPVGSLALNDSTHGSVSWCAVVLVSRLLGCLGGESKASVMGLLVEGLSQFLRGYASAPIQCDHSMTRF